MTGSPRKRKGGPAKETAPSIPIPTNLRSMRRSAAYFKRRQALERQIQDDGR